MKKTGFLFFLTFFVFSQNTAFAIIQKLDYNTEGYA
jgi:hypothetical protein